MIGTLFYSHYGEMSKLLMADHGQANCHQRQNFYKMSKVQKDCQHQSFVPSCQPLASKHYRITTFATLSYR